MDLGDTSLSLSLSLSLSPGGNIRINSTVYTSTQAHIDGCYDNQRHELIYVNEQYCDVCAQMVPTWTTAYLQDTAADLPQEKAKCV